MLDAPISQEIFFNGIVDMSLDSEVYRCTLFSVHQENGEIRRVEVCRLVCPASELPNVILQSTVALTQAAREQIREKLGDGQ